jgi:hypothetical protein
MAKENASEPLDGNSASAHFRFHQVSCRNNCVTEIGKNCEEVPVSIHDGQLTFSLAKNSCDLRKICCRSVFGEMLQSFFPIELNESLSNERLSHPFCWIGDVYVSRSEERALGCGVVEVREKFLKPITEFEVA